MHSLLQLLTQHKVNSSEFIALLEASHKAKTSLKASEEAWPAWLQAMVQATWPPGESLRAWPALLEDMVCMVKAYPLVWPGLARLQAWEATASSRLQQLVLMVAAGAWVVASPAASHHSASVPTEDGEEIKEDEKTDTEGESPQFPQN